VLKLTIQQGRIKKEILAKDWEELLRKVPATTKKVKTKEGEEDGKSKSSGK
jgi:hypothetical protein